MVPENIHNFFNSFTSEVPVEVIYGWSQTCVVFCPINNAYCNLS